MRFHHGAEPALVMADPHALDQILANLVLNVLDAAPSSGREISLRVGRSPDGRQALLAVADNGPDVETRNLGRIFDPSFTTKDLYQGTGLGLAVV
ncbi:hypothetical protein DFAR_1540018 [Desulfarculales bacterium]